MRHCTRKACASLAAAVDGAISKGPGAAWRRRFKPAAVEPLERRVMLSSAAGVEISGSSVGFVGKSLTFNADLGQGTSDSGLSYQWNLLNQYGSPYTPPGGLGGVTSSSLVLPGTVARR